MPENFIDPGKNSWYENESIWRNFLIFHSISWNFLLFYFCEIDLIWWVFWPGPLFVLKLDFDGNFFFFWIFSDRSSWDLAKELVRFLRTIDPEEVEEASQRPLAAINPTSPPINKSAPEEEISLLLGTLQVPRGRSTSVTHGAAKISPKDAVNHKDLSRSNSETKTSNNYRHVKISNILRQKTREIKLGTNQFHEKNIFHKNLNSIWRNFFWFEFFFRARIASTSSQKDEKEPSAEEFFIDVILQRHARKLLSTGRLFDLGTFAAQLDFHMVSWLKKESHRYALSTDFILRHFK